MCHARIRVRGSLVGLALAVVLFAGGAGAGSALAAPTVGPSDQSFYTPPSPLPGGAPGTLIWYRPATINLGSSAPGFQAWDVMYLSTDEVGNPDVVTGTVIVPTAAWTGSGARPVVDYAWGTQGGAQSCAGSEQLAAGTEYDSAAAIGSLNKGYAVVATDYEGYTNGGKPTYVAGASEGHAVLDAMRAAEQLPGDGIASSDPVIIWGYSQGGGAATWAGVLQPTYAPDIDLVGVAAGGVPADLAAVANFTNNSVVSAFEVYSLIGFAQAYRSIGIKASTLFNAQGLAFAAQLEATGTCALSVLGPPLSDQNIDQYLNVPVETIISDPVLSSILTNNDLGGTPLTVPYFQYSGEYDEFVPLLQQIALKQQFCSEGVTDDYHLYPGDHLLTDPIAVPDVTTWIANLLAGQPAPSTCNVNATLPAGARTTPETGDLVVPITNWQLGGSVSLKKLGLSLAFPAGATINASTDLTSGTVSGSANVPTIHDTIKILGIPITTIINFQSNPLTGTVSLSPSGVLTIAGSTTATVTINSTGINAFQIPIGCRTTTPVTLSLDLSESVTALASGSFSTSGTTTFPPLTGCGVLGPILSLLASGPGNPYTVSLTPPAPIPF